MVVALALLEKLVADSRLGRCSNFLLQNILKPPRFDTLKSRVSGTVVNNVSVTLSTKKAPIVVDLHAFFFTLWCVGTNCNRG